MVGRRRARSRRSGRSLAGARTAIFPGRGLGSATTRAAAASQVSTGSSRPSVGCGTDAGSPTTSWPRACVDSRPLHSHRRRLERPRLPAEPATDTRRGAGRERSAADCLRAGHTPHRTELQQLSIAAGSNVIFHEIWWHGNCKKVVHTRLPSVRFRSGSRFLAVSLRVSPARYPLGYRATPVQKLQTRVQWNIFD